MIDETLKVEIKFSASTIFFLVNTPKKTPVLSSMQSSADIKLMVSKNNIVFIRVIIETPLSKLINIWFCNYVE